jgi:hypothetical protein
VRIPRLAATVERRLLVNYRVDADVARSLLPGPLRPQLVDGSAVMGICLLRLGAMRPAWFAPRIGWGAENAAHRIAVEWDDDTGTHTGVYIPERHSASWLAVAAGDRVFPGVHHHAGFGSIETEKRIVVEMRSSGLAVRADVDLEAGFSSSLFTSVSDASAFFQSGAVGWSPTRDGRRLEGLRLDTSAWQVAGAHPTAVESTYFDSLPTGSARLDSVLVMRNVPITWSSPGTAPVLASGRAEVEGTAGF